MKIIGNNKVWSYVPDMDAHSYRSEYCVEIYNTLARKVDIDEEKIDGAYYRKPYHHPNKYY